MEYLLPDSLKDCDLKIIATGKMRNNGGLKGSIAFSLTNLKDSILLWNEIKSENHVRNMNAWVHFTDSLVISKQLNNSSSKTLRMFPYKNLGSGTFDIDDLVIELIRE